MSKNQARMRATNGDVRRSNDRYYLYASFPLYATLIVLYVVLFTDLPRFPDAPPMRILLTLATAFGILTLIRLVLLTYGLGKIGNPKG